ncbi:MAG TPA: hypothetical protein VD886_15420 [Herpetosiphonaceae bacterium]|nr:hypothetical protein [Herpetosiphonaceae bacterium]
MGDIERLVIPVLVAFAFVVVIVFRRRRWQGALGWLLISGSFIFSVLNRQETTWLSSSLAALVILIGVGLAGYDYLRFERPKRQRRRAERAGDAPPEVVVQRRRPSLLRRRRYHREERH